MLFCIYNPIADELKMTKQCIENALKSDQFELVNQLNEYILSYEGKMLRPAIMLLVSKIFQEELEDKHILTAAGLELIHIATLLHDDILDQAPIRWGRESIWKLKGIDAGVLLGDYLLSRAFYLLQLADEKNVLSIVSNMTRMICEGEIAQCLNKGNFALSEEEYIKIIANKTAVFFESAGKIGVDISSGRNLTKTDKITAHIENFCRLFGIAYQIIDDINDITESEEKLRKTTLTDIRQLKPTLPLIYTYRLERDKFEELIKDESCEPRKIKAFIQSSSALQYAREKARLYLKRASNSIGNLPESIYQKALVNLIDILGEDYNGKDATEG